MENTKKTVKIQRAHLENRVRFHRIHRNAGPLAGGEQVAPVLRVLCTTPEDGVCIRDGSEGSWRLQPFSNIDLLQQFTRNFGVVDDGLTVRCTHQMKIKNAR